MSVGYLSIPVQDEQEAVSRLKTFLVDDIGWSVAQDVTDTASDRDVVFSSAGETVVDNSFTRYIRLRGTSNAILLYTYETFTDIGTNTGGVADATYGLLTVEGDVQGFILSAVADLERVVLHAETYDGVRYQAYVGRITPYYKAQDHNYPNIVKGGQATTYDWFYSANPRNVFMRAPDGTQQHYFGIQPLDATALDACQSSDRNGQMVLSAPVLVHEGTAANSELAGEPRGVYRVPRETSQHNMFLPIDNQLYVVFESNGIPMAVGPVTASGIQVPRLQTDLTV